MSWSVSGFKGCVFAVAVAFCCAVSGWAQVSTPSYDGPLRNKDGSVKLALELGAGYDISLGSSRQLQTRGWNYTMGSGYNFNSRFGVLAEYTFNDFKVPNTEAARYLGGFDEGGTVVPLDYGNTHLWGVTAEPTYHFNRELTGAYVFGGGGFYRKLVSFTATNSGCQDTNTCGVGLPSVYHQSNNALGINGGAGLAWRPSSDSNAKIYIETRYVWIDNRADPHDANSLAARRTRFLPVTGGVRW